MGLTSFESFKHIFKKDCSVLTITCSWRSPPLFWVVVYASLLTTESMLTEMFRFLLTAPWATNISPACSPSSKIIPFNSDRRSDILLPSELLLEFLEFLCVRSRLCFVPAYLEAQTPAQHRCSSSAEITTSKQKPYQITSVQAKIDTKINTARYLCAAFQYSFEVVIQDVTNF